MLIRTALSMGLIGVLLGCGSSTITDSNGDGSVSVGPDAGVSADAREGCGTAYECTAAAEVCAPSTSRYVASLPCTTHADCGKQAFCQPSGVCAKSVSNGPCDTSDNCVGGQGCEAGGHCGCGGESLQATVVAPNMLIAIDRSQSMVTGMIGTLTRYAVAKSAINTLTSTYAGRIRFGLVMWPGNTKSCDGTGEVGRCEGGVNEAVAFGPSTSGTIDDYLATAGTCSLRTPIGKTLTTLETYDGFDDTTRSNYIVLLTDGEENCDAADTGPNAATVLNSHGVKTYAIGFSQEAAANGGAAILTNIATNGGTARSGTTKYYQADDADQLATAFDDIASVSISCDYTLSTVPDDPNRLSVYLGDTLIARDPTKQNGWDYDPSTQHLTFYGATCNLVRTGSGGELSVIFGCPVIP